MYNRIHAEEAFRELCENLLNFYIQVTYSELTLDVRFDGKYHRFEFSRNGLVTLMVCFYPDTEFLHSVLQYIDLGFQGTDEFPPDHYVEDQFIPEEIDWSQNAKNYERNYHLQRTIEGDSPRNNLGDAETMHEWVR